MTKIPSLSVGSTFFLFFPKVYNRLMCYHYTISPELYIQCKYIWILFYIFLIFIFFYITKVFPSYCMFSSFPSRRYFSYILAKITEWEIIVIISDITYDSGCALITIEVNPPRQNINKKRREYQESPGLLAARSGIPETCDGSARNYWENILS